MPAGRFRSGWQTCPVPDITGQVTPVASAEPADRHAKRRQHWLQVFLWAALGLAVAAHLYGLYTPGEPGASVWFPSSDKVLHFAGFAAPTLLAVLLARHWWPAVVFGANAVISELVQAWLLPGRDGDIWDVAADLSGVLAGLVVAWWLHRRASATAGSSPT